jgi:hypothetical protein
MMLGCGIDCAMFNSFHLSCVLHDWIGRNKWSRCISFLFGNSTPIMFLLFLQRSKVLHIFICFVCYLSGVIEQFHR